MKYYKTFILSAVAATISIMTPAAASDTTSNSIIHTPKLEKILKESLGEKNKRFLNDEEKVIAKSIVMADEFKENNIGIIKKHINQNGISARASGYSSDYDSNEIRADKWYKAKIINFNGEVKSIGKYVNGEPSLFFESDSNLNDTVAKFQPTAENIEYLSKLNKNINVDIRCVGGGLVSRTPILYSCIPLARYRSQLTNSLLSRMNENRDYAWQLSQLYSAKHNFISTIDKLEAIYLLVAKAIHSTGMRCKEAGIECFKKMDLHNMDKSIIKKLYKDLEEMTETAI